MSAKGKSLTGFYIAIGVVAALFGLGVWLWTPLRVRYWESEVRNKKRPAASISPIAQVPQPSPSEYAAYQLLAIGPQGRAAVERLLQHEDPDVRVLMVAMAGGSRSLNRLWIVPRLVEIAKADKDERVRISAVIAVADITTLREDSPAFYRDPGLRELLRWWDKEGEAKYGRPE